MLISNLSLGLNYNLYNSAIDELFKPIIEEFLSYHCDNATDFRILGEDEYITSYDFKKSADIPIKHIYLSLLKDIQKEDEIVNIPLSVFITFDKYQCPNYCNSSDRFYSSIGIGGINKVFYILFSTDELFEFLYAKETGGKVKYGESKDTSLLRVTDDLSVSSLSNVEKLIDVSYIKGYIDNHNSLKKLSFIKTSYDKGYPIYHEDFPEILNIDIGSILELKIDNQKYSNVLDYSLIEDKEIKGLIQFFDGSLVKSDYANYIYPASNDVSRIYVDRKLIEHLESNDKVFCLAIRKKQERQNFCEWSAISVVSR